MKKPLIDNLIKEFDKQFNQEELKIPIEELSDEDLYELHICPQRESDQGSH